MFTLANIVEIIQKYGADASIAILLVGLIYLLVKGHIDVWVFKKKRQITSPNETKTDSINDILESEFFRNIRFKVTVDIPAETFSEDEALDLLYKDLLICLHHSYQTVIKDKIEKIDSQNNTHSWVALFMDTIYHTMDEFDQTSERMGIPKEVKAEFVTWFSPFLHQIYNYITVVDLSEPDDIIRKTKLYLLTLELILVNATAQAQRFGIFEGKFEGMEYRGKIVGGK